MTLQAFLGRKSGVVPISKGGTRRSNPAHQHSHGAQLHLDPFAPEVAGGVLRQLAAKQRKGAGVRS